MDIQNIIIAMAVAAVSPFVVNVFSGVILTVKNRFANTPKFDPGAEFAWSMLPASGSIFPRSVLVSKKLTSCTFVDVSGGKIGGKYSITKFRWMISSASLVGVHSPDSAKAILAICNQKIKDRTIDEII